MMTVFCVGVKGFLKDFFSKNEGQTKSAFLMMMHHLHSQFKLRSKDFLHLRKYANFGPDSSFENGMIACNILLYFELRFK